MSDSPCEHGCQLGHGGRCFARRTTARLCELIADGRDDYREYVERQTAAGVDPEAPPTTPGLITRAMSYAVALAAHVVAGMPQAPPEVAEERLAICRGCEHFDPEGERCRLCTCSMPGKVTWADSSCPLDPPKWGPVG